MSSRLPRVTSEQTLRALRRDGWFIARQVGSHAIMRHPSKPGRLVVARHARAIMKPGMLSGILKDAGLTVEEFRALL